MQRSNRIGTRTNVALWIIQGLLALFFALGSGAPKLLLPAESLPMPIPLPQGFVLFIGSMEVLGALGLILPGLPFGRTRVPEWLTPLAATGLVLLTLCATVYQLLARQPESAVFALVIGLLSAVVAYGRGRVALRGGPTERVALAGAN